LTKVVITISKSQPTPATRNTRSRTHPYEKLKDDDVCKVRRTNSTFPDSNTAKILDSGCESIIRTFLGAAGSYYSSASILSKELIKKGKGRKKDQIGAKD